MKFYTQTFVLFLLLMCTRQPVFAQERDAEGSKDHPLIERMHDFYIGRSEELSIDKETFKTDQGRIEVEGKRYYIDYRLHSGKTSPGKMQILNYYQAKLKNINADVLLDGPYYDVYKININGSETWVKIDPGVYDGKRYEVTIIESNTIIETAINPIRLKELEVLKETGQLLIRNNENIAKSPKQFIYYKPQKIMLKTSVTNPASIAKNNLWVEFLVNGKVIDTSELVSLKPGEEKEIECEYELPDMGTYDIEVNIYEQETPHELASISGQLLGGKDTADVTGFITPDLEIRDLTYLINPERIVIEVQNNGATLNESVLIKTWFSDPYSSYSDYFDISIDMNLKPGERKWFDLIKPFSWPNPIDFPIITFTAAIDPDNMISEVDEKNNSIHKQLCINCGVHIDSLSTYSQTATGNQGPVYIYGQFGHKRASKRVVLIDKDSKKKYCLKLGDESMQKQPVIWQNDRIETYIIGIPYGTYNLAIYCSDHTDPFIDLYTSNYSDDFMRKRHKTNYGFDVEVLKEILAPFPYLFACKDKPLSAQSLANALADEFANGLVFEGDTITPPENGENIWVIQNEQNILLNAILGDSRFFEKIIFEVWAIEPRVRLRFKDVFINTGTYSQHGKVRKLERGIYEFQARYIYVGGQEISKSIVFGVQ